MDILRAVNSPNSDIRRKTLDIVLDLVTARNIDEVVGALKKEIAKSQTDAGEKAGEYRQMLVQAVHTCAIKFPETAGAVVHLLMDFLGDTNAAAAVDVAMFIREIAQTNASLREGIVRQLLDQFYSVRSARVCGTCLWIVGEYSLTATQVEEAFAVLKASLGPTPFFKKASAERVDPEEEEGAASAAASPPQPRQNPARPAGGPPPGGGGRGAPPGGRRGGPRGGRRRARRARTRPGRRCWRTGRTPRRPPPWTRRWTAFRAARARCPICARSCWAATFSSAR